MTPSRFRLLMSVSVVLLVAGAIAGLDALYDAQSITASDGPPWSTAASFGAFMSFLYIFLFSAGFIGMFLFRQWGRTLSLWTAIGFPLLGTVVSVALDNTVHVMPSSAVATAAASLSQLAWGAALAVAYYSPLSLAFRNRDSTRSNPLHGAA